MPIQLESHGEVRELVLDWPEVRNALGVPQGRELRQALEMLSLDTAVGSAVLTARGKAFCAGGKLDEITDLGRAGADAVRGTVYREFQGIFRALRALPFPVIAAVDGPAIGFGCDLALACNATFIGTDGWLAQGWSKVGLVPATGGALYAQRRGGPQVLWRMLGADRIDAGTAQAWGLGIACGSAREEALGLATRLAALPREAMRALVKLSRIEDIDAHLAKAVEYQAGFISAPDFQEKVAKFMAR